METHDRDNHGSRSRPPRRSALARWVAPVAVCAAAFAWSAPVRAADAPHTLGAAHRVAVPHAVTGGQGATVPFTTYEAENATTNGTVIGPDHTQGTVASEASGRKAVQLSGQGAYVQFTLTAPANAMDVSYNLPQGSSGSLAVYVDGSRAGQTLPVTSTYSYVSTGNITGSRTHHLFDDSRMRFGQNLPAGATVRLQVDADSSGGPFTIDLAQFQQVAAAATQPSGSLSVTSEGADPTGRGDSTNAFAQTLTAARASGQAVWIPPGVLPSPRPSTSTASR